MKRNNTGNTMNNNVRYAYLGVLFVAIVIAIIYLESLKPDSKPVESTEIKDGKYPKAPELAGIAGWINTPNDGPIKISDHKGKVVLVDFWTYSCINCLRTLPYLNAWHEKYSDKGLVIIGVHTPEFSFEKEYDNVKKFADDKGIKYPVVLDNDYSTWRNYRNQYWPRKYLIDKEGYIRYDHIGEGGYGETEKVIQELLEENAEEIPDGTVDVADMTPTTRNTPELYLGYSFALPRNQNIGNGGFGANADKEYSLPNSMDSDIVYLEGTWFSSPDNIVASSDGASIFLKFTAKTANIVMDGNGEVEVYLDGKYITSGDAGDDLMIANGKTYITVDSPRLYEVYDGPYGTHTLKLTMKKGISANAFTFG